MKTTLLFFSILLSLAKPFSCSKSKLSAPAPQIEGTWEGTYTVDQLPNTDPMPYRFIVKPGGELMTEGTGADGVTYYHKGTWKMEGNTFTATYTTINRSWSTVTQSAKMTYVNGRFINAVWTDVKNPDGHLDGKFQDLKLIRNDQLPGTYLGAYTINQLSSQPALRYVLYFKSDGTITTESLGGDGKTYYTEGRWLMTDSIVNATYKTINRTTSVVTQSGTWVFHKNDGTLTNGTWTDVINPEGHIDGKFQTFNRVKDNP